MAAISDGALLWEPTEEFKKSSGMYKYMQWLGQRRGLAFSGYHALWQWSVENLEDFWASVWEYTQIQSSVPYDKVLEKEEMPGERWFTGARLNYAEHVFRQFSPGKPAVFFQSEQYPLSVITWDELKKRTAAVANYLQRIGVKPGDRVVAYMPNIPQAVIAFLACASIGALWSSCSPDFGTSSAVERFRQITPKVLFAVDGYRYNGKPHDKTAVVAELQAALPSLEKTILVPYLNQNIDVKLPEHTVLWDDVLHTGGELVFEQVPFDHPLWVLYSSGTTGLPKPIVQGQGGILVEHLKTYVIQNGIAEDDRFFWFTTTGWMMWNFLVSALLVGAAIILYDGSPFYPSGDVLWELAEKTGMTFFGTSAGYIASCMKAGIEPGKKHDLSKLKALGSTGSPLTTEGFAWVYEQVKRDLWLVSISGGTDVCTGFVGGSPLLPVRAGEIQCRHLGVKVEAFDEQGGSLIDEVGELVVTKPMPSMPLYFWNDPGNKRYKESYFDVYPGVWRHGDWIKILPSGGCIIYGRSDSTINRQGVRMGTSEIYRVVESFDEVLDSLIVDLEFLGRPSFLPLFVVLKPGIVLTEELKASIKDKIRKEVSPRHVPDEIYAVEQIPRTLNGKKMEVPIRRLLLGQPLEKALNKDSMSNPESLSFFIELAKTLNN